MKFITHTLLFAVWFVAVANAQQPAAVRPGPVIVNTVSMKFALIPAGEFVMGSKEWERGRFHDELQHTVKITKPFYIGVTEVTQAQFAAVMGKRPSHNSGDALPVESVSWNDAVEFCQRLTLRERRSYRLPTEAEWEYACRAGTDIKYYSGEDVSDLAAAGWISGPSENKTQPAGKLKPNDFGLYDMLGNVFEWRADFYAKDYYEKSPAADPPGPAQGTQRIARGGAFNEFPPTCRAAARSKYDPSTAHANLGFRVCFTATR